MAQYDQIVNLLHHQVQALIENFEEVEAVAVIIHWQRPLDKKPPPQGFIVSRDLVMSLQRLLLFASQSLEFVSRLAAQATSLAGTQLGELNALRQQLQQTQTAGDNSPAQAGPHDDGNRSPDPTGTEH